MQVKKVNDEREAAENARIAADVAAADKRAQEEAEKLAGKRRKMQQDCDKASSVDTAQPAAPCLPSLPLILCSSLTTHASLSALCLHCPPSTPPTPPARPGFLLVLFPPPVLPKPPFCPTPPFSFPCPQLMRLSPSLVFASLQPGDTVSRLQHACNLVDKN